MKLSRPFGPVAYLAAQGVTLGLLSGFIIIPASGIFLERYGSGGLPWVYLAVAVVGAIITPGLASALQRWSLATVCVPVLSVVAVLTTAIWIGIDAADAVWMAFPLQVLFQVVLQLGFTFIGGQAGRLLTVRQMKEQFPRIVTGFAVGFMASGLLAPLLLAMVGRTSRLLAVASLCAGTLLGLVLATRRRFPSELSLVERTTEDLPVVPLRTLLFRPFVFLLLSYQVLSMLGTQLVDFLVYDRAAARYATSAELARFTSIFTVALNGADIVFLALLAAWMLRRYGMRLGLVANPLMVTLLVVAGLAFGSAGGIGSLAVFMAFAAARVADIVLTDGSTRTAINTAYQALPAHERLSVQAGVEGFGIPGAIGLAGIALLVLEHAFDGGTVAVAVFAVGAGLLWAVSGFAVYRGYQRNLHDNLTHRVLQPADVDLDDEATVSVVQRLLVGDGSDVALALDLMAAQPDGADRLSDVVQSTMTLSATRVAALSRLVVLDPTEAASAAEAVQRDTDSTVRMGAQRALGEARVQSLGGVASAAEDADPMVRLATMRAALRRGDAVDVHAHREVTDLLRADDVDVRASAFRTAAMLGATDAGLLGLVIDALGVASTASIAGVALSGDHPGFAGLLDRELEAADGAPMRAVRLVRCAARSTHPQTMDVLRRHVGHPSRDLGLEVLRALGRLTPQHGEPTDGWVDVVAAVINDDLAHANRCAQAVATLGGVSDAGELVRSLGDERALLRKRTLAALGLVIDSATVVQAGAWLDGDDERAAALALEALEVSMPKALRGPAVKLLQSSRGATSAGTGTPEPATLLTDLIEDANGVWRREWLKTCAQQLAVAG